VNTTFNNDMVQANYVASNQDLTLQGGVVGLHLDF
jgi:hypothetical protein